MDLKSRKEAKEQGLPKYYTGKACKQGHVSTRTTANGSCDQCQAIYQHNNLDKKRIRAKRHYDNNSEKCREATRQYRINNREKIAAYMKKYVKDNAAYFNEHSMRRYLLKMKRMPKWADVALIKAKYDEAERLTSETGIEHHVDHYYPLQGETVSGLHVHFNLQVITAEENLRKNNKHPDDFYGKQVSREDCSASNAQGPETNQASKAEEGLCISGFES